MNGNYQTPPVVKNLIIINVLVYMATSLLPVGGLIERYCALWVGMPFFHAYQFVTYMFLHADFEHIFFNMFALWMFGRQLEWRFGQRRFLVYYMVCGVGAALIQASIAWAMGQPMTLVGASGAVMGLLLAFGVLYPDAVIMLLIPPVPIKAKWFVAIYAAIELLLGWRGAATWPTSPRGGMLWGLALLWWWRRRGLIRF